MYIQKFKLENCGHLSDMELAFPKDCKEVYFAGDNMSGKTLMLRYLAMLLAQKKVYKPKQWGEASNWIEEQKVSARGEISRYRSPNTAYVSPELFGEKFNEQESGNWFEQLHYIGLGDIFEQLAVVLRKSSGGRLHLYYESPNVMFDFVQVTDMYRNRLLCKTATNAVSKLVNYYVAAIAKHLVKYNPEAQTLAECKGVAIIDDFAMGLDAVSKSSLMSGLREGFPEVQFIVSTNDPVVMLGASNDAVFYKMHLVDGNIEVSEPWLAESMSKQTLNILATSQLVGLDSSQMGCGKGQISCDASDDDLTSRIREVVKKQLANQPIYYSKELMDYLIQSALRKQQNP